MDGEKQFEDYLLTLSFKSIDSIFCDNKRPLLFPVELIVLFDLQRKKYRFYKVAHNIKVLFFLNTLRIWCNNIAYHY